LLSLNYGSISGNNNNLFVSEKGLRRTHLFFTLSIL
jgi:hypothetical protein